ncbi:MAG: hypothetical protein GX758_04600 [Tenericutes bacterium]|nr:hypothetical protein [Mycoplasmatota bacterium]
MKEATGELNMTVVTLIAIAAIGALFYFFVWPMIQEMIANQTCKTYGTDYRAVKVDENTSTGTQATAKVWQCCRGTTTTDCISISD